MENPKRGDDVSWQSHGHTVHGTVEKKITKDTTAAKRAVKAGPDEPQFLVRSAKTGKEAVHHPESLERE
jgi:hypothetical protein